MYLFGWNSRNGFRYFQEGEASVVDVEVYV
jgi:hypothetical protein